MNTLPITQRRATLDDLSTLVRLRIEFFEAMKGHQSDEAKAQLTEQLKAYYMEAIPAGECMSRIAYCGESVAGVGSMVLRRQAGHFGNPSGRSGYLMNMYTLPQYRRRGICSMILDALVEDGKAMGISAFELHATEEGEAVYAKYGFARHNEPTMRFHA